MFYFIYTHLPLAPSLLLILFLSYFDVFFFLLCEPRTLIRVTYRSVG